MKKKYILYTAVLTCLAFMLANSAALIRYGRDGMMMCFTFIIPSLFPFFVCSGLLIYSGFGTLIARLCRPFMRPLFNVSPSGAAAFVLGIISGFPLGAVTAARLYQSHALSKSEAERLLAFCNNSGPLFIIGTIGVSVYGRMRFGIMLYLIHITASVLVGIVFRFVGKGRHTAPPHNLITVDTTFTRAFSDALGDASKSIINVCFSIIFFYALARTILDVLSLPPEADAIIAGVCEFSSGVLKTSLLDIDLCKKLIVTSFIMGLSGISVLLQVMSTVADCGLNIAPYAIGKLLHGLFSAALTCAALKFIPITVETFSGSVAPASAAYLSSLAIAASAFAVTATAAVISKLPQAGLKFLYKHLTNS